MIYDLSEVRWPLMLHFMCIFVKNVPHKEQQWRCYFYERWKMRYRWIFKKVPKQNFTVID